MHVSSTVVLTKTLSPDYYMALSSWSRDQSSYSDFLYSQSLYHSSYSDRLYSESIRQSSWSDLYSSDSSLMSLTSRLISSYLFPNPTRTPAIQTTSSPLTLTTPPITSAAPGFSQTHPPLTFTFTWKNASSSTPQSGTSAPTASRGSAVSPSGTFLPVFTLNTTLPSSSNAATSTKTDGVYWSTRAVDIGTESDSTSTVYEVHTMTITLFDASPSLSSSASSASSSTSTSTTGGSTTTHTQITASAPKTPSGSETGDLYPGASTVSFKKSVGGVESKGVGMWGVVGLAALLV